MKNKVLKTLLVFTSLTLGTAVVASCGGEEHKSNYKYTYRTYLPTSPKSWNVHTWDTNDQSYIIGFTEMGLYDTILNEKHDGYKFVNEMAAAAPVDASAKLTSADKLAFFNDEDANIGKNAGVAWDIALNKNAVWEDGTKINADTYVESMKLLLDPLRVNRRADSFYSSTLQLANAAKYFKQGNTTIEPAYNYVKDSPKYESTDKNFNKTNVWYIDLGSYTPYINSVFSNADTTMGLINALKNRGTPASEKVEDAAKRIEEGVGNLLIRIKKIEEKNSDWKNIEKYTDIKDALWKNPVAISAFDTYQGKDAIKVHTGKGDAEKIEDYTSEYLKSDLNLFLEAISGKRGNNAWRLVSFATLYNDIEVKWESVGIRKIDEYTIRLITEKTRGVKQLDLYFSLGSNWIVKKDLYEKLTNASNHQTAYAASSVENYMSYGPYKLSKFQADKQILLEKNDKWYGYTDGAHVGQFQAEVFDTTIISKHETAMQKFEAGQIDDIELTAQDMKNYGTSSRIQFTPESYTQKISFNTDWKALESHQSAGKNKTILSNKDFRTGLSLSINRNNFAAQTTAGSQPSTNLLNSLYVTDVESGEGYRNTAQGKSVYNSVYKNMGGSEIGSATALNESAQGYNEALAIQYIKKAKATELASNQTGHFSENDHVDIEFRVYDTESETTKAMFAFLSTAFKKVGTAAGVTIDLNMRLDEDYYNSAKNGKYDMIFSTWGGAQMNPWGLMEVYCSDAFTSSCEYGFDHTKLVGIDSDGDGVVENKSFDNWYKDMDTMKEVADHSKRLNILSGLEVGIIKEFCAIPLLARSSASITSFKVSYATETYIPFAGYGGVRFMTFNYTDAQYQAKIDNKEITKDSYKQ
ncbi:MAG: ABC transporter substrate-binding protein [Bacilli bacterium]